MLTPPPAAGPRHVRLVFHEPWNGDGGGLFARDARARTLRRVLVGYPGVRHIVPDAVSLDAAADPQIVELVAQVLRRQQWLVRVVTIE